MSSPTEPLPARARRELVVADASRADRVELAWVTNIAEVDLPIRGPGAEPLALERLRERSLTIMEVAR
jgi:hypothetical protein